jgi:undecaprenyl-diphosphatase
VDFLNDVFVALTRVGTQGAIWVVLALVLALVWRRPAVLWTIPVVYLADGIAGLLKLVFDRPRPHLDPLVRVPASGAFPSGHAATAFAGAVMLSAFAPRYRVVFYLLALGIAFSRIYVGVHFVTDVLAGALIGAAVALTALRSLARFRLRLPAALRPG